MKQSPFLKLLIVIFAFIGLAALLKWGSSFVGTEEKKISSRHTILHMELEGVILNGEKFLKHLKKYREDDKVKAILIDINSPGGAVGPSQELFSEILRSRNEFKKPVICYSSGIVASGAYYAAAACDKLIVAPGSLIGSIGVIMQFANLEKLYDWGKIQRYSITSGKFKDSGAEYRSMREDERELFQGLIDEVYEQFKKDVMQGRNLKDDVMKQYADGRVFTGSKAVSLGFADQVGTYDEAVKVAADVAKLGSDYDIFEIPKRKRTIWDLGEDGEEDPINSLKEYAGLLSKKENLSQVVHKVLNVRFVNQPMLLMPGFWE